MRQSLLLTLALSGLFGCSRGPVADYDLVELVSVTGTVTLDGEPLADAVVTFEEPEQGTFAYGLTNADGKYKLHFDSEMMGCTPGEKRVEISTTRKILGLNSSEEGAPPPGESGQKKGDDTGEELVPPRYNKKSELIVNVDSVTTTHDFELTSPK